MIRPSWPTQSGETDLYQQLPLQAVRPRRTGPVAVVTLPVQQVRLRGFDLRWWHAGISLQPRRADRRREEYHPREHRPEQG